ncbi:hypothetical protein P7K49_033213 [Saguinus oedipus]|uniref:Uncharacterized protein n=1 Tax=Saguinus oedipus TaxID=9490 RepID=A0ABQ9TRN7_SAGOE|nr:hypothetical protein P7K49_033213 [Saguinus oedipus]
MQGTGVSPSQGCPQARKCRDIPPGKYQPGRQDQGHRPGLPRPSPAQPPASTSCGFPAASEARSSHNRAGRGRYPRDDAEEPGPHGREGRARALPTRARALRLMRFSQPGGSFSSSAIFPPAAAPAPPQPRRLSPVPAHRHRRLARRALQRGLAATLIGYPNPSAQPRPLALPAPEWFEAKRARPSQRPLASAKKLPTLSWRLFPELPKPPALPCGSIWLVQR